MKLSITAVYEFTDFKNDLITQKCTTFVVFEN